jgi:chemotaxis protein MotB
MKRTLLAITFALATTSVACVSSGRYDQAVQDAQAARAERDKTAAAAGARQRELEGRIAKLGADVAALEQKARERDAAIVSSDKRGDELQKRLDDATSMNEGLRKELTRLGKDADKLLQEKGALASSLTEARARLDELRRAQAAAEARAKLYRELALKLKKMVDAGDLSIVLRDGRMILQLPNDVLFDTGRVELKPAGRTALEQVAAVMRTIGGRRYQVGGHTDSVPISTARFPSNWELSAGRALAVVHILVDSGVDPKVLSAAGYSEFDPVASNESADGKRKNRRTEIALVPNIDELVAVPH